MQLAQVDYVASVFSHQIYLFSRVQAVTISYLNHT